MNKLLIILSIIIIFIAVILSTEYKHLAMTIFQLLYYHKSTHQDNKIFPSVFMEGNPKIPKIERDLIKYDKTKIDFSKNSAESIMVLHKNKIVIEEYYNNSTSSSKFNLFSATKTIISLAVGILQDRKLISINDRIKKYLPYLPLKDKTTIKDILQMSSGYEMKKHLFLVDMGFDYFAYNLTDRLINYKVAYNPGEYFVYKNLNTQILGLLIEKVSKQKLNEFIYDNLYKYVGREKAEWNTDRVGNVKAFCCLYLTNEDFLRFGKIILDKGKIGDKVIVSEKYVNEMFNPNPKLTVIRRQGKSEKNTFYGLQCWTLNTDDGYKIKYFNGMLGQYNIIVEDLDILISIFSNDRNKGTRENFEKIVKNYVKNARKVIYG
jgi:CubicO group peptidase (beta-lactamase class C family)